MKKNMYDNEFILDDGTKLQARDIKLEDTDEILNFLNETKDESRLNMALYKNSIQNINYEFIYDSISSVINAKNDLTIIGFINGEIVSIATINGDKKSICAHNGELFVLVKREYWERGVSKAMIAAIIEKAKARTKFKNISSILNIEYEYSIEVYEELGFEKVGIYRKYYKIGSSYYPGIVMMLNI